MLGAGPEAWEQAGSQLTVGRRVLCLALAKDSTRKRKRMGIEPTKRLFGRFTSFED